MLTTNIHVLKCIWANRHFYLSRILVLNVCSLSKMLCNFCLFSLQPDNMNDYKYICVYLKHMHAHAYLLCMRFLWQVRFLDTASIKIVLSIA